MSDLITTDETEAAYDMGSHNHSAIQANLAFLLKRLGKYSVYTELSLDVSQLDSHKFRRYDFHVVVKPFTYIVLSKSLIRFPLHPIPNELWSRLEDK